LIEFYFINKSYKYLKNIEEVDCKTDLQVIHRKSLVFSRNNYFICREKWSWVSPLYKYLSDELQFLSKSITPNKFKTYKNV